MAKATGALPALALAGILLSGCLSGGAGADFGADGGTDVRAPADVQVMSKSFSITGPRGYCIDNGATRDSDEGAFAVLGSCAVISGNPRDAKPKRPAMLTASVTPINTALDDEALDRMAEFFATDGGRSALARSDDAAEVSVIDLTRDDGMLLVHAEDGDRSGDVAGDYWRAVFGAGGRLVSVTVSGFRETPLDERSGAKLTRDFVRALRHANPDAPPGDAGPEPPPVPGPLAAAGERLASFFNRLP